jgi:GR25 family glycosyltransferase involved in LPS biosynthesis
MSTANPDGSEVVDRLFQHTYVINLEHRTDRWASVSRQLRCLGVERFRRFSAVTPERAEREAPAWVEALMAFFCGRGLRPADAHARALATCACGLSHLSVVAEAAARGLRQVMILEDDAVFTRDTVKRLAAVWGSVREVAPDALYLGGSFWRGQRFPLLAEGLFRLTRVKSAHAYLVTNRLFSDLLGQAGPSGLPIDWYYAFHLQEQWRVAGIMPPVAYQAPGYSDIEGAYERKLTRLRQRLYHRFLRRFF